MSRQAPGRKDAKHINGLAIQVRNLFCSLAETYALFKEEHPEVNVGLTKFKSLRPKHVLFSSQMPHNVCLCKYHENFSLSQEALHKLNDDFAAYSHETANRLVCADPSYRCWANECMKCCDGKKFLATFNAIFPQEEVVSWYVWENSPETSRIMELPRTYKIL